MSLHSPSQNREEHFVPRALFPSHPPPLTFTGYIPVFLTASLSLCLFFWRCSATSRFVLFAIRLFPSYPDTTNVGVSEWSSRAVLYLCFWTASFSRIPSLRDRYRSHRQHFRKHVFEPCIFIPLKQTILLSCLEALRSKRSRLFLVRPLGLLPLACTETAQPWASIACAPCFKVIRKIYRAF